jgi:hypothetical protein
MIPDHYLQPSRNDAISAPVSDGLGVASRNKYGSPRIGGDDGEDDGMGMENFKDLMHDGTQNEESSFVESAEKRDKVSMTFDQRLSC